MPVYRILSLYTGAGGLDIGFADTNRFSTTVCIEKESLFAETLRLNQRRGFFRESLVLEETVDSLSPSDVVRHHFRGTSPCGVIGGPPCQAFSIRGKRLGLEDSRTNETFVFMDWIKACQPRFFLMENVPRMLKVEDGYIADRIKHLANEAGYSVFTKVLNAAEYGSATTRQRVFIVGFKQGIDFEFPSPSHSNSGDRSLRPYVSSASALDGLPKDVFAAVPSPQGHIGVRHTEPVRERFEKLRPGQQDDIRKRTRLDPTKPAPTLVAGNLEQTRSHIHPFEPRELTNRESARLHGFSDDFVFAGNHAAMGVQIANSVPIPLAQAIAFSIADALDKID